MHVHKNNDFNKSKVSCDEIYTTYGFLSEIHKMTAMAYAVFDSKDPG